jgi:LacI family transcriptional regulator
VLAKPRRERPTAIFAVTDILALGGLDAAAQAHVPVPGRLSIAGFDDIGAAANTSPSLTTIDHDLYGQGQQAARLVLRLIAGQHARAPHIQMRLVARASTAAAPASSR